MVFGYWLDRRWVAVEALNWGQGIVSITVGDRSLSVNALHITVCVISVHPGLASVDIRHGEPGEARFLVVLTLL